MTDFVLCYGYGSNMSTRRMLGRTPSARLVGRAKLRDYRLVFHKESLDGSGKADVVHAPGQFVWGAVYNVPVHEKKILDRYEALGKGYDEKMVEVTLDNDEIVEVFVYYATRTDAKLKSYSWYLTHIIEGAKEHNLPEDYIEFVQTVAAVQDPDRDRERRELSVYGEVE